MKKILLEGPVLTRSGYGEHCRLVYRSLLNRGLDIYIKPLDWGATSWIFNNEDNTTEVEEINHLIVKYFDYRDELEPKNKLLEFDVHIHVGILNEFEKKAPYAVCVTAGIETDTVAVDWLLRTHTYGPHAAVDKIIVPSVHAKDGFLETAYNIVNETEETETTIRCVAPVEVVPYPVKEWNKDQDLAPYLDLGLETNFNFLFIGQLGPRKNIKNMIEWFVKEFREDADVGLVLKVSTASSCRIDKSKTKKILESMIEPLGSKKCKVYLLQGDLTDAEIHSLYINPSIKAYATVTHGEGYGLPIFEAAYSGLPVIATNWSGHLDFLSGKYKKGAKYKNKKLFSPVAFVLKEVEEKHHWAGVVTKGSKWAFPEESSFREKIRKVYKLHGMYKKWASILQAQLLERLSKEKVYDQMYQALLREDHSFGADNDSSGKFEEVMVL